MTCLDVQRLALPDCQRAAVCISVGKRCSLKSLYVVLLRRLQKVLLARGCFFPFRNLKSHPKPYMQSVSLWAVRARLAPLLLFPLVSSPRCPSVCRDPTGLSAPAHVAPAGSPVPRNLTWPSRPSPAQPASSENPLRLGFEFVVLVA